MFQYSPLWTEDVPAASTPGGHSLLVIIAMWGELGWVLHYYTHTVTLNTHTHTHGMGTTDKVMFIYHLLYFMVKNSFFVIITFLVQESELKAIKSTINAGNLVLLHIL